MNVVIHAGTDEPKDVWAVVWPSVMKFIHEDGMPYGKGNALEYVWGDARVDLEITIQVWQASDGIHARRL